MELILKNWFDRLLIELENTSELRIISPFVKEQVLRKIHGKFNFKNFQLITRFNLQDFAISISSLDGIRFCIENEAKVFGIKNLHSKVYIFDKRAAIVTSANLTNGGLITNYECGLLITDPKSIKELLDYFDYLKSFDGNELSLAKCEAWEKSLSETEISNLEKTKLNDFGATENSFDNGVNYYIKFFGKGDSRVDLNFPVKTEIDRALCHYACGFPANKKPRQVNDGDIIFMARMTHSPNDYSVFGRAVALKYIDVRDEASKKEKKEREWKKQWPIYLRVEKPKFINGVMGDGILLSDLMKKFDYNSFPSTRDRYDNGERNIKPTKSLMRKAYVKLTQEAAEWLNYEFDTNLTRIGNVGSKYLNSLPQTTTDVQSWNKKNGI